MEGSGRRSHCVEKEKKKKKEGKLWSFCFVFFAAGTSASCEGLLLFVLGVGRLRRVYSAEGVCLCVCVCAFCLFFLFVFWKKSVVAVKRIVHLGVVSSPFS